MPNEFLCTHEPKETVDPVPIIFEVTEDGLTYVGSSDPSKSIAETLKAAGGAAVPATAVGFGRAT